MSTKAKIAFWCYLGAMTGPGVWGVMFLFRSDFMPYHAAAVGMPWSEVPEPFQILIMALLKLAGGGWITVAISELVLLLVPFRQGPQGGVAAVLSVTCAIALQTPA